MTSPPSDSICNMIPRTTLAYLAGAVDSDGTIGIKVSTYAMRVTKDCQAPTYSERVSLKQVTPEIVDTLHQTFQGSRRLEKPSAKKGRPLYSWTATDRVAFNALSSLLPYLRVKRAQAQACIELRSIKEDSKKARVAKGRGHVGSAHRSKAHGDAMAKLKLRIAELNRVGIR